MSILRNFFLSFFVIEAHASVSKFNDHLTLRYAMGVCMDQQQNIYTSDYYEHVIQKIDIFGTAGG
jgi:hypothetical protein